MVKSFVRVLSQMKETTEEAVRCRLSLVLKTLLAGQEWDIYSYYCDFIGSQRLIVPRTLGVFQAKGEEQWYGR